MFKWLRRGKQPEPSQREAPPPDLNDELARLEATAERSPWSTRANIFNRAGDLCASAGDRDLAQSYYGRGIDAYL